MSRALLFDLIKAKPSAVNAICEVVFEDDNGAKAPVSALMRQATPFVFDDDAVRNAVLLREKIWRDTLIDAAHVPFEATWIEYNPRAKLEPHRIAPDTSERTGHLILRDNHHVSMLSYDRMPDHTIHLLPYMVKWSLDGSPVPLKATYQGEINNEFNRLEREVKGILTTGRNELVPEWVDRFGGLIFFTIMRPGIEELYINLMREHASVPTLAMALLALLTVKGREEIAMPRGDSRQVFRGATFRGSAHTVVRVNVPLPTIIREAKHAATGAKRRWHMVREHPRTYHRGTSMEFTITVASHPRGDETLGKLAHDYVVKARGNR